MKQSINISKIKHLLQHAQLPTDDIQEDKQHFICHKDDQQLHGVIALEEFEPYGLLRSLAVDPNSQNKGIGKQLVAQCIDYAKEQKLKALYLLTTTAEAYFYKLGWIPIRREDVPAEIQASSEFSKLCPASASCMYLSLEKGPVEDAVATFTSGFNCAQSVFSAFAPQMDLEKKTALMLSSGFNGGINGKGGMCGVVTGAYMALGLKHGRFQSEDIEAREKTSKLITEFDRRFLEGHGGLRCRELLGANVSIPEEKEKLMNEHAFERVCPLLVKEAAEIISDLLAED